MTSNRQVEGNGFQASNRLEELNRNVVVSKLDALSIEPCAIDLHAGLENCRGGVSWGGEAGNEFGGLPRPAETEPRRGGGGSAPRLGHRLHHAPGGSPPRAHADRSPRG